MNQCRENDYKKHNKPIIEKLLENKLLITKCKQTPQQAEPALHREKVK